MSLLLLGAILLAIPQTAYATETHVSTDVQTVSGIALAEQLVRGVSGVELGGNGATVTVDVDGQAVRMPVDYSRLLGGEGDFGAGPMLLLLAGVTLFLRFLGLLLRLGR